MKISATLEFEHSAMHEDLNELLVVWPTVTYTDKRGFKLPISTESWEKLERPRRIKVSIEPAA